MKRREFFPQSALALNTLAGTTKKTASDRVKLGLMGVPLRDKADECLQFALSLDCVDCMTIGSESHAELGDLVKKIPAASVRG
jgi:hypothetical protein